MARARASWERQSRYGDDADLVPDHPLRHRVQSHFRGDSNLHLYGRRGIDQPGRFQRRSGEHDAQGRKRPVRQRNGTEIQLSL